MRKIILLAFLMVGCAKTTHHELASLPATPAPPPTAIAIKTPISYELWWEQTEQCSKLIGAFDSITFYVVPNDTPLGFTWNGDDLLGLWIWPHFIFIAQNREFDALVVRHEMLHNLLRVGGHPDEYYCGLCKGLVDAECLYRIPALSDSIKPEAERW